MDLPLLLLLTNVNDKAFINYSAFYSTNQALGDCNIERLILGGIAQGHNSLLYHVWNCACPAIPYLLDNLPLVTTSVWWTEWRMTV